ncbi:unnamed protein product [Rotaria magnacalcarata]
MSTHNTPNRLRHTPKTARAYESVIVERQVLHVFVQNEIVMMKIYIGKNDDLNTEKTPRTPKPTLKKN